VERWGEKASEKLGFPLPIMTIKFDVCVLLAFDFDRDGFLCALF